MSDNPPTDNSPSDDLLDINAPERGTDTSPGEQNQRSHATLSHPEERLRLLEENVKDYAIVIMAADGQIVNWNAGAERIMGWTEAETVNQPASLFYTPEDCQRDVPAQELARAAREGRSVNEQWHIKKDGSYFWASGILSSLRDRDGSLRGFTKILRDMTEQRQAQEEQKRTQEELAAAYVQLSAAFTRERHTSEVLQRSVLLGSLSYDFGGLELSTQYEPASDDLLVGGDFFDAFQLADGRAAFAVGDVLGKGLDAAAHTAQIKFALRAYLREYPQPALAVQRLNSFLYEAAHLEDGDGEQESKFTVLCLGVVNPASGEVLLAGAGIEPPLILRASGEVSSLKLTGTPLGMMEKSDYGLTGDQLEPGDVLFLTTDGITETRQGREFLEYEGLIELARRSSSLPDLDQKGRFIVEGARAFGGGVFRDDVCLLLARRK